MNRHPATEPCPSAVTAPGNSFEADEGSVLLRPQTPRIKCRENTRVNMHWMRCTALSAR